MFRTTLYHYCMNNIFTLSTKWGVAVTAGERLSVMAYTLCMRSPFSLACYRSFFACFLQFARCCNRFSRRLLFNAYAIFSAFARCAAGNPVFAYACGNAISWNAKWQVGKEQQSWGM